MRLWPRKQVQDRAFLTDAKKHNRHIIQGHNQHHYTEHNKNGINGKNHHYCIEFKNDKPRTSTKTTTLQNLILYSRTA